jgi:hypothetical protein
MHLPSAIRHITCAHITCDPIACISGVSVLLYFLLGVVVEHCRHASLTADEMLTMNPGTRHCMDGRHASITANEMRHIGENGVGMKGSTVWVDGRDGNQPRFNSIDGNLIHHLGLYTKQACAIFSAVSCQNNITNNIMFHGPRALVNMNDVRQFCSVLSLFTFRFILMVKDAIGIRSVVCVVFLFFFYMQVCSEHIF